MKDNFDTDKWGEREAGPSHASLLYDRMLLLNFFHNTFSDYAVSDSNLPIFQNFWG